eukprot:2663187-Prymnesium_polylepis.1
MSKARSLEGDFELNNVMIALLLIFKLPESSSVRSDMIMKDTLPSPASILLSLQQIAAFSNDSNGSNHAGYLPRRRERQYRIDCTIRKVRHCHNCDGTDHQGF